MIRTTYGQHGTDSPQTTEDVIKVGKNPGKKNETSPYTQAKAEAEAKHEKKIKSGYSLTMDKAESGDKGLPSIDPMLAHSWEKQGKSMEFPCHVQPKYDGLRMVAVISGGEVKLYSRTRKPFKTLPHIEKQLIKFCRMNGIKDAIFDGEAYSHQYRENFNEIVSRIKRDAVHPDSQQIDYHIYDLPSSANAGFADRHTTLSGYFKGVQDACPNLLLAETYVCKTKEQITVYFERFLDQGYEGAMLRGSDSLYENKRSKGLIKYKTMQDDEFKIIGVQEGRGKLMGAAGSFVCITKDGKQFNAKLKGELDNLKEYFVNFNKKYLGQRLTVQYFNMTPDGLPRFPVGLRLRPDND